MIKVRIEMDEGWMWWPKLKFPSDEELAANLAELDDPELKEFVAKNERPSMEIPEELLEHYQHVSAQYFDVIHKFEQLYRKQEGYPLYETPKLPYHRMLKDEKDTGAVGS